MSRLSRLLFGFIFTCSFDLESVCLIRKLGQSYIITVSTPTLVILPTLIPFDFTCAFPRSIITQVNSGWIRVFNLAL